MADKKFNQLTALVTPVSTDIYAGSANGAGSFKETRAQLTTNMNATEEKTAYTTSANILPSAIIGGIIYLNPPDGNQSYTFPSAASIYAAMGSRPLNYFRTCKFINLTEFPIQYTKTDPNLSVAGMPTLTQGPLQTFVLDFNLTQITPDPLVTINGGQNTSFARILDGQIINTPIGEGGNTASGAFTTLYAGTLADFVDAALFAGAITVDGPINFPSYTPLQSYVGNSGLDFSLNNGQIISPHESLTVAEAVAQADSIREIIISAGPHIETSMVKKPNVAWLGAGKGVTVFTTSSGFTLDATAWAAATSPRLDFFNMDILGSALNFSPTALKSNSSYNFQNCTLQAGLQIKKATTVTMDNVTGTSSSDFYLTDIENSRITNCFNVSLLRYDQVAATLGQTHFIDSCPHLSEIDVYGDGTVAITVRITNCPEMRTGQIAFDDPSFAQNFTFEYDAVSAPNTINDIESSGAQFVLLTDIANGVSTVNGFSLGNPEFAWDATAKVFTAGYTAHNSGTTKAIILGRSTSSRTNVFVAAMDNGSDFFTNNINQFAVLYTAGYAFGTGSPGAYFHVKAGATNTFLSTSGSAVADGNISNLEFNPYITTDTFHIKYKGSTGTVSTLTFPNTGGTIPLDSTLVHTTGNESVGGTKTFTGPTIIKEIQNPLVQNKTPTNHTATTETLTNAHIAGGIITLNPTLAQTLTLPTGTDMDTIYNTPNTNRGGTVRFVNQSALVTTLTANTGFSLTGCYLTGGFVTIPANSARDFDVGCQGTATYVLFG